MANKKERTGATLERKKRNVARQEALAGRSDYDVSENCKHNRRKRDRLRDWKKAPAKDKRGEISPTKRGERQFGPDASEKHLLMHGRIHAFDAVLREEKRKAEEKKAARDQALMDHVAGKV